MVKNLAPACSMLPERANFRSSLKPGNNETGIIEKGYLMIRLTIMYNLATHVNEEEFLEWRLSEHQKENMASPGVIRSDFSRIEALAMGDGKPPHRYMTTMDWPDMESFREAFYNPEVQKSLQESQHMVEDILFLISEILVYENNEF